MILIKAKNSIVNMDNCQGITRNENIIIFDLPEGMAYNMEYASEAEAVKAFNNLFKELAEIQGVDGAVLGGDFN